MHPDGRGDCIFELARAGYGLKAPLRKRMADVSKKNHVRAWLATLNVRDNPAGALVAELRAEPALPTFFHSQADMEDFVRWKGWSAESMAAVKDLWPRWRRWANNRHLVQSK